MITCYGKNKLHDGTLGKVQRILFMTTLNTFLSLKTFGQYLNKLAIIHEWDYYIGFDLAIIPISVHIQALIGRTSKKKSSVNQQFKIEESIGTENLSLYTPKTGGAPQIYIHYLSQYEVYDLGFRLYIFKNFSNDSCF